MDIPSYDAVVAAHERIRPHVHRTPVLTSSYLDGLTGASLFFKCENFQKAGAFKVRGASNAVFGLSDARGEERRRHALLRQSCPVAELCRRSPRHPGHRRHAAHGAGGEEGGGARLRRHDRRVRAEHVLPRGGLRRGAGADRRRIRPSRTTIRASSPARRPARGRSSRIWASSMPSSRRSAAAAWSRAAA